MAKLRDILTFIEFPETERSDLVFSDATKLRLDPVDHNLKLTADSDGKYSTDNDLWIKTQQFWAKTNKIWRGFYADVTTPTGTSLGFRLNDGTNNFWWAGSAWATPGASDWNTEEEIATNIVTFPAAKIKIVINLKTTDEDETPLVNAIKLGYSAQIVFLEQWIYRTLVPLLRDNVRPLAAWPLPIGSDTTTIDLNNYSLDAPFNLDDIDTVYNHTDDADHQDDIFQSYNSGTQVITLSTTINAGKVAWINFTYEPEVSALTSVDYHELSKAPALTIENLRLANCMRSGHTNDIVAKYNHTGIVYEPPWQCELQGDIIVHAPRSIDEMALVEEVISYISDNQTITTPGTGEKVDWFLVSLYERGGGLDMDDLRTATLSFVMRPLRAWIRAARTSGVYAVTGLKITGDMSISI